MELQNKSTDKVYFENLDGLRDTAAFAVVFKHIASWFPNEKNNFI